MKKTYNQIIHLLYTSTVAEGGDGGGLWRVKHRPLSFVKPLLEQYNTENKTGWGIQDKGDYIMWGDGQEWVHITTSKEVFDRQAPWDIVRIEC